MIKSDGAYDCRVYHGDGKISRWERNDGPFLILVDGYESYSYRNQDTNNFDGITIGPQGDIVYKPGDLVLDYRDTYVMF